jgi:hypothetical protein
VWTILADSKIQSVDIQDSSSSFGVGAMHQGQYEETSLIIRKGTSDTLTDQSGARVFGAFVLAPETAKLGASARHWWFGNRNLACRSREAVLVSKHACDSDVPHDIVTIWRYGLYSSVDVGMTNITSPSSGLNGASLVAGAMTIGFALRRDDDITIGEIARPVALGFWLGPTVRIVGGDLSEDQRGALLNNRSWLYGGVEVGGLVRLANFTLTAKVSWIGKDNGDSVSGLSRLQFVPSVQFILPFDIVEGGAKSSQATKEQSGAPAGLEKPKLAPSASISPSAAPSAAPSSSAPPQ